MSSKITLGGKVAISSDRRGEEPSLIRGKPRPPPSPLTVDEEIPYERQFLTKVVGQIDHSPDGIRYRVFKYLDPRAGWCTAEQIMEEFDVPYEAIVDWAVIGHIEPGMEQGSPSRRFRVKDMHKTRQVAKKWLAEAAKKQALADAHTPQPKMIHGRWWK